MKHPELRFGTFMPRCLWGRFWGMVGQTTGVRLLSMYLLEWQSVAFAVIERRFAGSAT
jgi:hypothetical protein